METPDSTIAAIDVLAQSRSSRLLTMNTASVPFVSGEEATASDRL